MSSKSSEETPRIRYASAAHLHIAAVINGAYHFDTLFQATKKLDSFKRLFTVASEQEENPEIPSLILWIRHYDVSEEEAHKGAIGNFCHIKIEKASDGLFTLVANKLVTEPRFHPMRKRQKARCPNWGHPILRAMKNGHQYATIEEVNDALQSLHLEYPETTIPASNKLYIMVFSRSEDPKNPIKKYVLEIKHVQGGGFTVECKLNEYNRPERAESAEPEREETVPMGHFSSMIALKRNRKSKKKPTETQ